MLGLYKNTSTPDNWALFYGSYLKTYIERDVRQLINVKDELAFVKFISVAAVWTGQILNKALMADVVGVSAKTIDHWLSVLVASHLVYLQKSYSTNLSQRAIRTPKLYFPDTGLAAYLVKWITPEALSHGKDAGAFFETFVIAEVLKSFYNAGIIDPPLYYYRDRDGREIDLLIEQNGLLHPVEIKTTSNPKQSIGEKNHLIPVWYI